MIMTYGIKWGVVCFCAPAGRRATKKSQKKGCCKNAWKMQVFANSAQKRQLQKCFEKGQILAKMSKNGGCKKCLEHENGSLQMGPAPRLPRQFHRFGADLSVCKTVSGFRQTEITDSVSGWTLISTGTIGSRGPVVAPFPHKSLGGLPRKWNSGSISNQNRPPRRKFNSANRPLELGPARRFL